MIADLALDFAMGCFGLGLLLNLWRLWTAPTVTDRILAVDTMTVNMIALIVLYGVAMGTTLIFEAALILALTGFVATVAFSKYLLQGDIIA
jgi:multicomponent K+:H+ antiporter subunit F